MSSHQEHTVASVSCNNRLVSTNPMEKLRRIIDDTQPLKASSSPKTTGFAVARGVHNEHAFKWWVPFILSRLDSIATIAKKRTIQLTHEHIVHLSTLVTQSKNFGKKNDNALQICATNREIKN